MLSDRQKQLLTLLVDGRFHSGRELADTLGVSRTSIWKHLQCFNEMGLEIVAVSGKGYRLLNRLSLLEVSAIEAKIPSALRGRLPAIHLFEQIDSTNTYLMNLAQQGALSGMVCLAEYQSAGRGRRGRNWVSPFGANIYLSILWRFNQGLGGISGLSLVMGIAVIRTLRRLGYPDIGLKWPNDIYWQQRKLGGILVEVTGESNGPVVAVIGLGLNVCVPPAAANAIDQAWVDLQHINNHLTCERNDVAAALLTEMLNILNEFENLPLAAFLDEWRAYDCLFERQVKVVLYGQEIVGVAKGINDNGLLLLQHNDGITHAYTSGEISFNLVD